MRQDHIKALLEEAAKPDCDWQRRTIIQCELCDACAAMGSDGVYEIDNPAAGLHLVINNLYFQTLQSAPDKLPSLFPVFAMICGDRDPQFLIADINWDLA